MKSQVFLVFLALFISCEATYLNGLAAKYAAGPTGYPVTIIAKAPVAYTLSPYGLNTVPVEKPAYPAYNPAYSPTYNYPADYPVEAYTIVYEAPPPYGVGDAPSNIPVSGSVKTAYTAPGNPAAKIIYYVMKK